MQRNRGFHGKSDWGMALSPYLFTSIMDVLTNCVQQDEVLWCMMFADNVVLVDENTNVFESNLNVRRS